MRVIQTPSIQFTCENCKAVCEGEVNEFEPQNTLPPSWYATCAFCNARTRCFPQTLIAQAVGLGLIGVLGGNRRTCMPPPRLPGRGV